MWVVRAVELDDLDSLLALIRTATKGLTSLQLDRTRLLDRIEQSVFAFSRSSPSPWGEPYVLVMADTETGEVVGTATVFAKTGGYQPFYTYQVVTTDHHSELLGVHQRRTRLELLRIHDGPTEIGSLFLLREHRGAGRGRWLSLARFALIAMRPTRFADRVIAEMRGYAEDDGTVPFWESVAARFIPVDFAVADTMSTVNKQFIEELMPHEPIYLNLLPPHVRKHLGQVHAETVPALRMLEGEGFRNVDQVDIFDGGPVVSCETTEIDAVRRCQWMTVAEIVDGPVVEGHRRHDSQVQTPPVIVASESGGFTSLLTHVRQVEASGQGAMAGLTGESEIVLGRDDAVALGVERGSRCMLLPLTR